MEEKDQKASSIRELLREKERIEKNIDKQFSEYVTILFTDIAGYTNFVETYGDLAAKSLLQNHNDILFPIIEENRGNVIKTIGDAVMASFPDTNDAVNAAILIQKALKQYNLHVEKIKKINIRIGIHAGNALRDGDDYFGDAVNVAARIEPAGSAGQIMVSKTVYNAVKDSEEIYCRYHGKKMAKGKAAPIELYRVFLSQKEELAEPVPDAPVDVPVDAPVDAPVAVPVIEDNLDEKRTVDFSKLKPVVRYDLMLKTSVPLLLILFILFVYPGFLNQYKGSNGVLTQYVEGFKYLRNGDFEKAKTVFLNIGREDFRCNEGLAAIAYKNRSYDEAEQLCDKSIGAKPDVFYPRVIKGNIFFDKGEIAQAKKYYNESLNFSTPLQWQKGEAYFRMGRISSFEKNPSKALQYYNQAADLDRTNADIVTAKGVILEKMGELSRALDAFQTAQKIAPNDAFASAFYRRAQRKLEAKEDKEKQKRVNTLVNELITSMKEKKQENKVDRWTSRPVTLFFTSPQSKGSIGMREGEDQFFELEMVEQLRKLKVVDMVDRELLDKLLAELKMSSSDLADPSTALELGRIMSARLIGNLKFFRYGDETKVYVRMIETETSAVKISLSEKFGRNTGPDDAAEKLATAISEKLKSAFPVRGRIKSVNNGKISINIGYSIGVQKGMVMRVFASENEAKKGNTRLAGAVKVISVKAKESVVEIIKGPEKINQNCTVEAVSS